MKWKLENGTWKIRARGGKFSAPLAHLLLLLLLSSIIPALAGVPPGMVLIPAGVYQPYFKFKTDRAAIPIKTFHLDVVPVSNGDYLEFVQANPRWQRSLVKRLFADELYLKDWRNDLDPGSNAPVNAPVTGVSWFAAKAYAQWRGKRLPTTAEWEYAASAGATRPDGENDPQFKAEILQWYSTPASAVLPSVSSGRTNYYGVRDLHGLVWEWVADFNSAMISDDSPDGNVLDRRFFCAAGSQGARNVDDYPAFMRYAFRSSLKADYCIHDLGFRCAKDL
jgi:formylglycine-generating enzyme required for sulfatase activity